MVCMRRLSGRGPARGEPVRRAGLADRADRLVGRGLLGQRAAAAPGGRRARRSAGKGTQTRAVLHVADGAERPLVEGRPRSASASTPSSVSTTCSSRTKSRALRGPLLRPARHGAAQQLLEAGGHVGAADRLGLGARDPGHQVGRASSSRPAPRTASGRRAASRRWRRATRPRTRSSRASRRAAPREPTTGSTGRPSPPPWRP